MLNVAVIEDNDELRDVMVDTLRSGGHRAIGMDSAEAMTDQSSGELIDILVVDINLPGEDGFSLARRLRAIQPRTGIILVTGRNRDSDRRAGFEGGADIFLTKPVSTEELTAAVASLKRRLDSAPSRQQACASMCAGVSSPAPLDPLRYGHRKLRCSAPSPGRPTGGSRAGRSSRSSSGPAGPTAAPMSAWRCSGLAGSCAMSGPIRARSGPSGTGATGCASLSSCSEPGFSTGSGSRWRTGVAAVAVVHRFEGPEVINGKNQTAPHC